MARPALAPVSLTYADAAESVGVSVDVIRRAVRAGDLTAHYPTARPVIRREDLDEWIKRTPTERAS
jgi:excisionase family DNA binding protein